MLESKVTFTFKESEQVLITSAIEISKRDWPRIVRMMSNEVIQKVNDSICHLDGSEMRIIAAALTFQGVRYSKQGLRHESFDALSLAGHVHMARVKFHHEWSNKLGG